MEILKVSSVAYFQYHFKGRYFNIHLRDDMNSNLIYLFAQHEIFYAFLSSADFFKKSIF